jgi:serine/threonine-protein phosphatase 5
MVFAFCICVSSALLDRYSEAADKYSAALAVTKDVDRELRTILFSNRAFCQLKCENYGLALSDAKEALNLDPTFVKAFYRRGEAHYALGKYKEARMDFKKVLQLKPNDKDAKLRNGVR